MDVIELRGLTWYGYHGAFAEEQRLGQRFVLDLRLELDLSAAGRTDDLDLTVDYGKVAETVRAIVEGPAFKLIEALAEQVAATILGAYPAVGNIGVRVAKPSAAIPSMASGLVAVEISRSRVRPPASANGEITAQVTNGMIPNQVPEARPAGGAVLTADAIRALQRHHPPLIQPLADPDVQIQPNGVDLSLESVWRLDGPGSIGVTNTDRIIPNRLPVDPEVDGWYVLSPGSYIIRFREVVALPLDVMAFGRPRSSLLRSGAAIHTAVWDAGYHGRSEALLVVVAEAGVRLAAGARMMQLVFTRLEGQTEAYAGAYQGENIRTSAPGAPDPLPIPATVAGSQ